MVFITNNSKALYERRLEIDPGVFSSVSLQIKAPSIIGVLSTGNDALCRPKDGTSLSPLHDESNFTVITAF